MRRGRQLCAVPRRVSCLNLRTMRVWPACAGRTSPSTTQYILEWVFFSLVSLLPLALAIVMLFVAPERADRVLQASRDWLLRNRRKSRRSSFSCWPHRCCETESPASPTNVPAPEIRHLIPAPSRTLAASLGDRRLAGAGAAPSGRRQRPSRRCAPAQSPPASHRGGAACTARSASLRPAIRDQNG